MKSVIVYGTAWCRLTFNVRECLMRARVAYEFFDIDRNAKADEFVRKVNGGSRRYPVVVVARQTVITPMLADLRAMLDAEARLAGD
jgi:glutaredoxin